MGQRGGSREDGSAVKVWVVVNSYYDDLDIDGVYLNETQARDEHPVEDESGFPTGVSIIEAELYQ